MHPILHKKLLDYAADSSNAIKFLNEAVNSKHQHFCKPHDLYDDEWKTEARHKPKLCNYKNGFHKHVICYLYKAGSFGKSDFESISLLYISIDI